MRAVLLVVLVLAATPLVAAALPSDPGSEVPVFAPVGADRGFTDDTYWDGHQFCTNYPPGPVPSVAQPPLASFVHPETTPWNTLDLTFHFHMTPRADGSCPPLTFAVQTTLTAFPDHTFYDMPVNTPCGIAYLSDTHYDSMERLTLGSGFDGCIPGVGTFGAAYADAPNLHPSTYVVCDPLTAICPGVTQYAGSSSCGDGSTDGSMFVVAFGVSRSCDGNGATSWSAGGPFVFAGGNANGCQVFVAIVAAPCAAPVGTAFETVPWGHVLP